jgi:hypothetical protein
MRIFPLSHAALLVLLLSRTAAADPGVFRTVDDLWRGYDPRALPLEVETVAEEKTTDGIVRTVYYTGHV